MACIHQLICLFGILVIAALPLHAESSEVQLRQIHLELVADLNYEEGSLKGKARITLENASERPATTVSMNLNRLLQVSEVRSGDEISLSFKQDVLVFTDAPKKQVTHILVQLPHPVPPGRSTVVELTYSGYLVGYTETGSTYIQDRIHDEFSILRIDALAFPEVGGLSQRANRRAPRTDFTFETRISVPEGFVVASAGELIDRSEEHDRWIWHYRSTAPVPFLNLPIAKYGIIQKGGVEVFHFPEDEEGARRVLAKTFEAIDLLTEWFGTLSAEPRLAIMEIPVRWGSQASLTAGIIQEADIFKDSKSFYPLYHELSHLWNARDMDSPSSRWNEGLATYLQFKIAEQLDNWGGLAEYQERLADRTLQMIEGIPGAKSVPFSRYGEEELTDLSYGTGFLFFTVLEEILGEKTLLGVIGEYYQSHRDSGGSLEELKAALQQATTRDLTTLFEEWLNSVAWQDRLRHRESVRTLAASY